MELLNRGLITEKQAARIFERCHDRNVSEVECALNATSDQWEVMYKDVVRNVCEIDRLNEKTPAEWTAWIRGFTEATVAEAIGDESVENVFWSTYEDLLRKRKCGLFSADCAIHRIVLKRS